MKQRKMPMRMCVGCREMKPKKDMVRIVRAPEGAVTVDRTGKASGRGAYVCTGSECLGRAVKQKALDRALETKVDDALFEVLSRELERRVYL